MFVLFYFARTCCIVSVSSEPCVRVCECRVCAGGDVVDRRRHTPTLDEALQVVLGRSRPTSAAAALTTSVARATPDSVVPKQFVWSPMFMSPGSSQNPRQLGDPGPRPGSGPGARAEEHVMGSSSGLDVFADSRGLFQRTLDSHQHAMTSQHQATLHDISAAACRAVDSVPDGATMPVDSAHKVAPATVDRYNAGNGSTVPGNGSAAATLDRYTAGNGSTVPGNGSTAASVLGKCVANSCAAGNCCCSSVVPSSCASNADAASSGKSASQQSGGEVLQSTVSQDSSTMSRDSLTAAEQLHQSDSGTRNVATRSSQASAAVHCNSAASSSSASSSAVDKSSCSRVKTDVNGNVAAADAGAVCLDSRLWEGLRPTSNHGGTNPVDIRSHGRADWVTANLAGVEVSRSRSGCVGNGSSVSAGTADMCADACSGTVGNSAAVGRAENTQSGGLGNAVAVNRADVSSVSAGGASSFFLHRNSPSPNVAIVQPSVHPASIPQTTATADHFSTVPTVQDPSSRPLSSLSERNVTVPREDRIVVDQYSASQHSVHPSSTVSGGLQEQNVPNCRQSGNAVAQCSASTHPSSNAMPDCPLQQRSSPSRATDGVARQPVVAFVSSPPASDHTMCPPSTMTVDPPEKDRVVRPQPPDTYRLSSADQAPTGTIFAIPPSYAPTSGSDRRDCSNHRASTLGFSNDKFPTLDFPSATCIRDNITYEDIPVDDTSSVSSVTSDIVAAAASTTSPGQQYVMNIRNVVCHSEGLP